MNNVLNGKTGSTIATYTNTRIGQYCQPQLYDVDGDGILDILVPLYYVPGLAAVKYVGTTTLSQMWVSNVQGSSGSGSVMAKPVAGDVDHDGLTAEIRGQRNAAASEVGRSPGIGERRNGSHHRRVRGNLAMLAVEK
jgi:hypothetical protein